MGIIYLSGTKAVAGFPFVGTATEKLTSLGAYLHGSRQL